MYYYEKDYIMRMIHGTAMVLARILLGRQMEEKGEIADTLRKQEKTEYNRLIRMIDGGNVNRAEEQLFGLLETAAWEDRRKAVLALAFYDYLNGEEDEFLKTAGFSREEIVEGLEDAMRTVHMEIPEYLRI